MNADKLRTQMKRRGAAELCLSVAFAMGLFFAAFSIASPWLGFAIGMLMCALITS